MELPWLPAYTVFTSISLAVAAAYLLLCWIALHAGGVARRFRPMKTASCRPGEVIHQALKITGRRLDQFRTAALVFAVAMLMLTLFGRIGWWPAYPQWVYVLAGIATTAMQGFGVAKIVQLVRYRIRLSRLLDKHVAMSRRLAEAQLRGNRVYHSVPVGDAIIDNVIVGPNGVYSVHLVPSPHESCSSVSLVNGNLLFQPADQRHDLRPYHRNNGKLADALGKVVGCRVTVLPVIVVPDCQIQPSAETLPMVASLESCMAFVGWKDPRAFLMNDELDEINRWLDRQSLDDCNGSMRAVVSYLDPQVMRPALV